MSLLAYCKILVLFALVGLSHQLNAKALFIVEGKAGNQQAAVSLAYKLLSQKIIDQATKRGRTGVNSLNSYHKLVFPKILKVVRLGRTLDGKHTRVRLELNNEGYVKALEALNHIIKQEIRNFINSKGGSYKYFKQLLFSYKVLLAIKVKSNSIKLSNLRRDYFYLKKKIYELSYLAELRFIGETQNAHIYVDGQKLTGSTKQLLPGKHVFEIFKSKHFNINGSLMLNPGEKRSLLVRLIPTPKKIIPINLVVNNKLNPYIGSINEVLRYLGFSTNSNTIFTMSIKWSPLVQDIDNKVGVKKKKILNLISIELLDISTSKILIAKDWHQEQTLIDGEVNSEAFIADMLRRAIYHLYPQINRETLIRMQH